MTPTHPLSRASRRRNHVAKDLATPKYRQRVLPDKRKDPKVFDQLKEWLNPLPLKEQDDIQK